MNAGDSWPPSPRSLGTSRMLLVGYTRDLRFCLVVVFSSYFQRLFFKPYIFLHHSLNTQFATYTVIYSTHNLHFYRHYGHSLNRVLTQLFTRTNIYTHSTYYSSTQLINPLNHPQSFSTQKIGESEFHCKLSLNFLSQMILVWCTRDEQVFSSNFQ